MTAAPPISATRFETIPLQRHREFCLVRLIRTWRQMPLRYVLISLALLIPCWWQPHIAAGDLASHAYNAWLVQLIKRGAAPGLWIAPLSTNVLFDYMLDWLTPVIGVEGAQRLSVGIAVLVFFWAAFALISAIAKKLPWTVTPVLAILAYGTVFNMGLFNYYIGGALSLAALAILWEPTRSDAAVAILFFGLGWLAQPLPVLWTLGVLAYIFLARTLPPKFRLVLPAVCLAALLLVRNFILRHWFATWSWRQAMHATGADQGYMFGSHYRSITLAIAAVWAFGILQIARDRGWSRLLCSIPFQVYAISVAGCFLLPYTILFPWYKAAFGGVPERVAWLSAIFVCALIAEVRYAVRYGLVLGVVALVFFVFLYSDARAINKLEQKLDALVSKLPPDQRVIGLLRYPPNSGFDESMLLDRACIGKCFSFGNYEASTQQFRVRAAPGNSIVAWGAEDSPARNRASSRAEQFFLSEPTGTLYFLHPCGNADICMQAVTRRDVDSLR
jgi:hypothetical protein